MGEAARSPGSFKVSVKQMLGEIMMNRSLGGQVHEDPGTDTGSSVVCSLSSGWNWTRSQMTSWMLPPPHALLSSGCEILIDLFSSSNKYHIHPHNCPQKVLRIFFFFWYEESRLKIQFYQFMFLWVRHYNGLSVPLSLDSHALFYFRRCWTFWLGLVDPMGYCIRLRGQDGV